MPRLCLGGGRFCRVSLCDQASAPRFSAPAYARRPGRTGRARYGRSGSATGGTAVATRTVDAPPSRERQQHRPWPGPRGVAAEVVGCVRVRRRRRDGVGISLSVVNGSSARTHDGEPWGGRLGRVRRTRRYGRGRRFCRGGPGRSCGERRHRRDGGERRCRRRRGDRRRRLRLFGCECLFGGRHEFP